MITLRGAAVGLALFAFLCFALNQATGAILTSAPKAPDAITGQFISGVANMNAGFFWGWVLPVALLVLIVVLSFIRGDSVI